MEEAERSTQELASLVEALCQDPEIEFVLAFGSMVSGSSRSTSDLDVAVRFVERLSAHERFEKRCFLSGELQRQEGPFIDIADLDRLPLAVAHDAVQGEFLCGDREAFNRFRSEIDATFEHERDDIRRHQQELIDRIAREGLGG